ncbi:hypothetical protein LCGC14_0452290 [marine sediment metagenome]|uniref:Uncharacterized protein n=1 Tax=marine sediment metagenome TaxID=412755 RepID=A0A0F9VRI0_9ZZZZ
MRTRRRVQSRKSQRYMAMVTFVNKWVLVFGIGLIILFSFAMVTVQGR